MSHNNALLQPCVLGNLSLRNRVVMAPMTRNFSPGNVPGDNVVEYYRRRAAGGTGLFITEGTCVGHIAASGYPDVPYFHGEERLAGWRRVVEAVHAEGGKIAPQLWHVGGMRKPTITVGSVGLNADFIPKAGETTFREAEPASLDELLQRLQAGEFDLVAVGRALLANPDWVQLLHSDGLANMKAFRKEYLATLA
ncbi:MAG: hypothetical protein RLP45_18890 [Haliea sp.]